MSSLKANKIPIDISADKSSRTSRSDRALVVGLTAPNSSLWKAQPALQDAGTKLIAVGAALGTANTYTKKLEADLEAARGFCATKEAEYDVVYGVYIANVQTYASTPEDAASLGVAVRTQNKYSLVVPLGLTVSYDAIKGLIHIHVTRTPGVRTFAIEISPGPIGSAIWQRIEGNGAVRDLSGYAPGLYLVRAASTRSKSQSDFTAPVAVIVK